MPLNVAVILIAAIADFGFRIVNSLVQLHVTEVRFDKSSNKVIFFLNSLFSGNRVNEYDLTELKSILKTNNRSLSFLRGPFTLKILLPAKKVFNIDSRYGFKAQTLKEIDASIGLAAGNL